MTPERKIELKIMVLTEEIKRLNGLIDIAYSHLQGAGYKPNGIILQRLETGCTMLPNV